MEVWSGSFQTTCYTLLGLSFIYGDITVNVDSGQPVEAVIKYKGTYQFNRTITIKLKGGVQKCYGDYEGQTFEMNTTYKSPIVYKGEYTTNNPYDRGTFALTLER